MAAAIENRDQFLQDIIDRETNILVNLHGEVPNDRGEFSYDPLFVTETTRGHYEYQLNHSDVVRLLDHFSLKLGEDDHAFVIGCAELLEQAVAEHEKSAKGSLVVILHQPPDHWATMVFWKRSHIFFADSKCYAVDRKYSKVVSKLKKKYKYHIISRLQQVKVDEVNCGLWALGNAEQIRLWLVDHKPEDIASHMLLPTVKATERETHFRNMRMRLTNWMVATYQLNIEPYQAACNPIPADPLHRDFSGPSCKEKYSNKTACNPTLSDTLYRDKKGRFCEQKNSTTTNPEVPRKAHAAFSNAQMEAVVEWILTYGHSRVLLNLLKLKEHTPLLQDVPFEILYN